MLMICYTSVRCNRLLLVSGYIFLLIFSLFAIRGKLSVCCRFSFADRLSDFHFCFLFGIPDLTGNKLVVSSNVNHNHNRVYDSYTKIYIALIIMALERSHNIEGIMANCHYIQNQFIYTKVFVIVAQKQKKKIPINPSFITFFDILAQKLH